MSDTPLLDQPEDKTRTYLKVPSAPLTAYLERTGITPSDYAKTIGVTASCVGNWIRTKEMPVYIGLLVEEQSKSPLVSIIVTGSNENIDAMMPILNRFDLTISQI